MNEQITNQLKKPIFKNWWFWLLIVIVLGLIAFGIAGYRGEKHNKELTTENAKTQTKDSKKDKDSENISLASDLPACPSDTSQIFTKPFMDGDKPDFIIPLGNSNQDGHVVPVDHVYPSDVGYEKDMSIYASSDMTLIFVENKQMHNSKTDAITRADYQLNFAPCRGLNLAFIHLKKLSPKLEEAIEDENSNCDTRNKLEYGEQEGVPTYYYNCHPDFKKVRLSAGELIGYFSGQTDKQFSGFDIGLYDYNKSALGFINPARYYDDTNHTVCFADYYTSELKAKYYAKFGSMSEGKKGGEEKFTPVKGEPKCGKVMHDVASTASGDWFKNNIQRDHQTDNEALVLIHDNIDTSLAKLSMAGITSFTFTPKHSGQINREFSEVTADGKTYCYLRDQESGEKVLLQLVDDMHLKVEKQSGTCTASETFTNPLTYER